MHYEQDGQLGFLFPNTVHVVKSRASIELSQQKSKNSVAKFHSALSIY